MQEVAGALDPSHLQAPREERVRAVRRLHSDVIDARVETPILRARQRERRDCDLAGERVMLHMLRGGGTCKSEGRL